LPKSWWNIGVQDDTDVLERETLFDGGLADTHPGDVALADVHDALDIVDQMVNLALQDRLEVGLHFPAGHLDENAQGKVSPSLTSPISGPSMMTLASSISFISAILTSSVHWVLPPPHWA
jgi:hypothetical protein